MNGIKAAFVARVGRVEGLKTAKTGKRYLELSALPEDKRRDRDEPGEWVKVRAFMDDEHLAELDEKLRPGALCYAEGSLSLGRWTGKGGEPKAGLNLMAWRCESLFQIGRGEGRRQRDGEHQGSEREPYRTRRARSRNPRTGPKPAAAKAPLFEVADDDLPF